MKHCALQELPVFVDFSDRTGKLMVLLLIIAVVHNGCRIARFQSCYLCIDFCDSILGRNPSRGEDSPFLGNHFFQALKSIKGCKLLRPLGGRHRPSGRWSTIALVTSDKGSVASLHYAIPSCVFRVWKEVTYEFVMIMIYEVWCGRYNAYSEVCISIEKFPSFLP